AWRAWPPTSLQRGPTAYDRRASEAAANKTGDGTASSGYTAAELPTPPGTSTPRPPGGPITAGTLTSWGDPSTGLAGRAGGAEVGTISLADSIGGALNVRSIRTPSCPSPSPTSSSSASCCFPACSPP